MANQHVSSNIKVVKQDDFQKTIEKGVVLVDFYADWCGPCRMLSPVLETVASEVKNQAIIAKLDINDAQNITSQYDIKSIPTLILFKEGKEVGRLIGLHNATAIKQFILAH